MRDRIGNRFAVADHPVWHGSALLPHGNAANLRKDLVPLAEEDIVDTGIVAQDGRPRLAGDIGSAENRRDVGRDLLHPSDNGQRAVDLRKNRAHRQHPGMSLRNLPGKFFHKPVRLFPGILEQRENLLKRRHRIFPAEESREGLVGAGVFNVGHMRKEILLQARAVRKSIDLSAGIHAQQMGKAEHGVKHLRAHTGTIQALAEEGKRDGRTRRKIIGR